MKVQIFALSALLVVAYVAAGCPEEDGEHVVYLPNPKDCSSFFQCSNGQAFLLQCAEGTQWNAELSVCDWAEEVGCVDEKEDEAAIEVPAPPSVVAPVIPPAPPSVVVPVVPPADPANFPRSN